MNAHHTTWPSELIVLQGGDRDALRGRVEWLRESLRGEPQTPLADLAQTLAGQVAEGGLRLSLIAASVEDLMARLDRAAVKLASAECRQIRDVAGIYFSDQPLHDQGAIAFLYPGEGAQYLGMLGDMMPHLPEVRQCFDAADEFAAQGGAAASSLSRFTRRSDDPQQRAADEAELRRLDNAMFSVLVADWALTLVLEQLGVQRAASAGHSAGELAALMMSGSLVGDSLGQIVGTMQQLESTPGVDATLLAVGASREAVERLLSEIEAAGQGAPCQLAMDNCPHQTVIVGLAEPMAEVERRVKQAGFVHERLVLGRPYHTPLFDPLMGPLTEMFAEIQFQAPSPAVYSCTTGEPFPGDPEQIRQLCIAHWRSRVEFVKVIRRMYDDGVRIFVETGPRGNLCSFVEDILRGRPFLAAPANVPRRHGLTQLQHMAGQLAAHGVPLQLDYFFRHRSVGSVDWARPAAAEQGATAALPAASSRAQVLQSYWGVMDEFLAAQQEVMTQFLQRPAAGQRPGETPLAAAHAAVQPAAACAPPSTATVASRAEADAAGSPAPTFESLQQRPLVGEVLEHSPRQQVVVRRVLDLHEDLYAGHHTVGGRSISKVDPQQHGLPIMPMTFTVEMMAENAQLLAPELVVRHVKNIQLMRWLAFYEDDPASIELTCRCLEPDDEDLQRGEQRVLVQIWDLGRASEEDAPRRVAAVGTVVLGVDYPPAPAYEEFRPTGAQPCDFSLQTMYNNLFHGELFQAVDSLDVIGEEGIEGTVHVRQREGLFASTADPQFIGDPVLLDVVMHPPCAWHLDKPDQSGRILLPFELKSLDFFGPRPAPGQKLRARTLVLETTPRHFTHVTEAYDESGRLWARINRIKLWRFYLPFKDVNFHGPKDVYFLAHDWPEVLPPELQGPGDQPALAACVRLDPLDDLRGPALLGAAARVTMSPQEFERFVALDIPDKEKPAWLFRRLAAKDAVRILQRLRHSERPFMADVEIGEDPQGRPLASPRGRPRPDDFPSIAIAQTSGLTAALAAAHPHVGLAAAVARADADALENLSAAEQQLCRQQSDPREAALRLSCAKQAVAQALPDAGCADDVGSADDVGCADDVGGLQAVGWDDDQQVLVALDGQRAEAHPQWADKPLVAWTRRDGDHIVAGTLCWQHTTVSS